MTRDDDDNDIYKQENMLKNSILTVNLRKIV